MAAIGIYTIGTGYPNSPPPPVAHAHSKSYKCTSKIYLLD